jgi:anti-anti-sigma factor
MGVNIIIKNGIKIAEIAGKMDSSTAPDIQNQIMEVVEPGCKLVLEMSKCTFVSSAGLRVLLIVFKKLKTCDGKGVVCGLSDEIKDVMEMTGFDDMFDDFSTLDQAIKALK